MTLSDAEQVFPPGISPLSVQMFCRMQEFPQQQESARDENRQINHNSQDTLSSNSPTSTSMHTPSTGLTVAIANTLQRIRSRRAQRSNRSPTRKDDDLYYINEPNFFSAEGLAEIEMLSSTKRTDESHCLSKEQLPNEDNRNDGNDTADLSHPNTRGGVPSTLMATANAAAALVPSRAKMSRFLARAREFTKSHSRPSVSMSYEDREVDTAVADTTIDHEQGASHDESLDSGNQIANNKGSASHAKHVSEVHSDTRIADSKASVFKVRSHVSKDRARIFHHMHLVQCIGKRHLGPIWAMRFSTCGRMLATAGQDKAVRVWARREHFTELHQTLIKERVDPAYATREIQAAAETDILHPTPLCEYFGHTGDILDLCWSPSQHNGAILTSSMDMTVRLWHLLSKDCLAVYQHQDFVTALSFHPKVSS